MSTKNLKLSRLPACMLLILFISSACGLIYKQNIQQGNALEQDDLDELYIGMNKRQVSFVLGSPSIQDPFQQERWDYVQTFSRRGHDMVQRTVTLRFEEDLLVEIIGVNKSLSLEEDENPGTVIVSSDKENVSADDAVAPDPHTASVEAAKEEALEPEIQGLGERSAEDREMEEDMDAIQQRSPDDLTSPDIGG